MCINLHINLTLKSNLILFLFDENAASTIVCFILFHQDIHIVLIFYPNFRHFTKESLNDNDRIQQIQLLRSEPVSAHRYR